MWLNKHYPFLLSRNKTDTKTNLILNLNPQWRKTLVSRSVF